MSEQTKIVNDLSIQVATENGSGSQSANSIIVKSLFRMGIPVGGKNIFPSNIAGLPTWFIIRANKNGYVSRKKDVDMVILMNQETIDQDIMNVKSGGVVIFNSDLKIKDESRRTDIVWYPVPFGSIARENFTDIKLRKLLTNMLYVGFLTEVIGLEDDVVKEAISDSFFGKTKAIELNINAYELGKKAFRDNFNKQDSYFVERMNKNEGKIVIDGNSAAALGALFGGCTALAWYPITPASSVCESLLNYFKEFRVDENGKAKYAEVQAEDELAAVGMLMGAGWAGARAFTATAGPGISLMAEFVGLGYFVEIPAVIWNVQRMGPSTGLPTRTSQGDLLSTYFLSHGDTKHVILLASSIEDCFDYGVISFDIAEQLQTPVFVFSDLDLGMNNWTSNEFKYPEQPYNRGKVLSAEDLEKIGKFERYRDVDGDGVAYRTLPGTDHRLAPYFARGTGHNEKSAYSEKPDDYKNNLDRLTKKLETAKKLVPKPVIDNVEGAKVGIIAYGSTDSAMTETRDYLAGKGIKTNYLLLKALPLTDSVKDFIDTNDIIYVAEQNRDGQLLKILCMEYRDIGNKLRSVLQYNGWTIEAMELANGILEQEGALV